MPIRCDECPHWTHCQYTENGFCDVNGIATHASTGCLERELELWREGQAARELLMKPCAPPHLRPKLKLVR